jgi:arabinogalactan oligomer/maltooligosaccharide transport system permease protein
MPPEMITAVPPKRNRARFAALLSFLFMGLGQLFNRQYIKGILYAITELYVLFFLLNPIINGIWGLITLGDQVQVRKRGRIVEQGDHSIFMMIEGLIFLLVLIVFLLFYLYNIRDAYKIGKLHEEGKKVNSFKESLKNIWENGYAYVLLTPAVIFTIFLTVLPLLFGILIAFTNYSSPNHLPPRNLVDWVGFDTFINLFKMEAWSNTFYGVAVWNIIWAILATFTTFFVGMFFALIIDHKKIRLKRIWRTIFILPWAIPQFISILIFRNIFNGQFGPLNQYLEAIGFDPIPWLSDPFWAKFALVTMNIWLGFPYWMALIAGVLTNIDKELYEAADVDGANWFQKFRKITFPLLMYATSPLLIMSFAGNINNFNVIFLFTQGGPKNGEYSYAGSTDILISWIYKLTLDHSQFNMAAVISILIFIVVASFSIWNFRRTRAFKEEEMM